MAMAAAALAGAGLSGRRPKRRLPDPFLLCAPDTKPLPLGISALYLDLDGVFADFERAVFEFLGKKPNEMRARDMWPPLAQLKYPGFFGSLPPMPGADVLWELLAPYKPIILSGLPLGKRLRDCNSFPFCWSPCRYHVQEAGQHRRSVYG
jgi:hypothetical protein